MGSHAKNGGGNPNGGRSGGYQQGLSPYTTNPSTTNPGMAASSWDSFGGVRNTAAPTAAAAAPAAAAPAAAAPVAAAAPTPIGFAGPTTSAKMTSYLQKHPVFTPLTSSGTAALKPGINDAGPKLPGMMAGYDSHGNPIPVAQPQVNNRNILTQLLAQSQPSWQRRFGTGGSSSDRGGYSTSGRDSWGGSSGGRGSGGGGGHW